MRKNDGGSRVLAGALIIGLAVSLLLLVLEPVAGGRHYEYALVLCLALAAIAALASVSPRTFFGKAVAVFVLVCGLGLGAGNLAVVSSDAEIVRAYQSVFDALDSGRNPYTSGTIFHEIESFGPVYGNFNYPPLEIAPYYLAYRIAGTWNMTVLAVTMVLIHALCCLALFRMFPAIPPVRFLPFLPMFLLGEIKTNAALAFLLTALVLWAIRRAAECPRPGDRYVIAVLFGLGAMTKFLTLPLMVAYYAREAAGKSLRSLARAGVDILVVLATACLVMAPFGVVNVMKNTALFNVVLEDRAVLTTFYPNVLSGPLAWLGLQAIYPLAALVLFGLVIRAFRKSGLYTALFSAVTASLLLSSTPEPQFLPIVLFLVVVAQGTALEKEASAGEGRDRTSAGVDGGRRVSLPVKRTVAAGLALVLLAVSAAAGPAAEDDRQGPTRTGPRVPFCLASRPPGAVIGGARFSLDTQGPPAEVITRPGAPPRFSGLISPARKKRARAWIELGALTLASSVDYWLRNAFPEDKDFRLDFDSQFSRVFLLEGWRFDSNEFSVNWAHGLAGALYYQFGRANRQSWPYSWLMAFAASTWWEIVGETKEVIAINDQIMTGLGALALGEPWYRIGHFLCHQPGPLMRGLGFLDPAVKLNHWLDRRYPADDHVQPGWHEIKLFAGGRRLSSSDAITGTDVYFGFEARLTSLPEYGRPGAVRRDVRDAFKSEITLDCATRGGRTEETRFFTKAVPWGRFVQEIGPDGRGSALFLGFGSAFEYFKKRPLAPYDMDPIPVWSDLSELRLEEPRSFTDKLAILHLAGPVLDWTVFRRASRFRAFVEAYLDFALVNATALNDYSRLHDIAGLKTTVFYYGYYYGFGGTVTAGARLDWKGLNVRGLVDLAAWGSADLLDRFPADVTNNAHLSDTRARALAGLAWRIPRTSFELFFDIEGVRRRGSLAEVRAVTLEKKAYLGLAFVF